ncbi:UDP-glucose 4-epimerase [Paenibacillus sp. CAA11]|uniref:NAD-dependent epimerase/dehydratase family protein n=1 Tax=Paenibacillus sp. CAA11 TaxID=1532905 RepID=UPI000D39C7EE|nr:NAD-dependent epimerase/dehydratase family protein [Paenibacillus sp. CAA11]AWB45830.1 UDP-glucose 4-epimerase [Paenibacillus sp. CAA11]
MKAVVTGGAGFIGSHLVEALLAQGADVAVIDNLSTGHTEYVPKGVQLYQMDIRSEDLEKVLRSLQPEIVFHQAAQVDVQHSVKQPGYDAAVNIAGTANLLKACQLTGVRKVIYASSCAVYGELEAELIREGDPTEPISFYGLSKKTPEIYLQLFHQLYGLSYTILRYANVYGPRQTPKGEGGVVSIFLDRIRRGEPLMVFGDGEQTRDFVYVKDVAAANVAAAFQADQQIVQVSTAAPTSVNQLLDLLSQIHGQKLTPEYHEARAGDIKHSCLSNSRADKLLGWKPKYNLEAGLKETYQYMITEAK